MTRAIFILAVCLAAVGCSGGTTKVVQDHSVAQKFAGFNKSGWSVTGGGVNNNPNVPLAYRRVFKPNVAPNAAVNPLARAVWSTNFQVDAPKGGHVTSANGVNVVGPKGSSLNVAPANSGGGMSVTGPAGTGAASVNAAGKPSTNIFTQIGQFFSGKSK